MNNNAWENIAASPSAQGAYKQVLASEFASDMLEALRMFITAWEDMHEESVAGIREHDLDMMNAAYGAAREAVDKAVASS